MIAFGFLLCSAFSFLVCGQIPSANVRAQNWRDRPRQQMSAGHGPAFDVSVQQLPAADGDASNPRNWRELLTAGDGVHDVMDFINLLTKADGAPVTESDIFSPYETEDGKRVITGGGLMATSDECSPRNMSVRLPLDYSDNQIAYYPECTMVQRCGGCCPTQFLSCEPRYKEKIVLKVLRARYLYPGAFNMQWEGFSSVEVERHLSCQAVCRLTPRDCGPLKRFIAHQCKCQCLRFDRCSNDQVWDDETCSCRCQDEAPCCEEGEEEERTCNMYYDHDWCECTLKTAIGAEPNATQAEIEAWLASRNRQVVQSGNDRQHGLPPSTTDSTTTTTTPTTTAAPTTANPCSRSCPRNFVRRRNASGRCVCTIRSRYSRQRYPRRG